MTFREFLKENIVILDGGMGTLLQAKGLMPGEAPEMWNLTRPGEIEAVHRAYFDAKCDNEVLVKAIGFSRNADGRFEMDLTDFFQEPCKHSH